VLDVTGAWVMYGRHTVSESDDLRLGLGAGIARLKSSSVS
jgi:hypothetical protein